MKRIASIVLPFIFPCLSFAQWNTSGNNISNTNTGNVGIGFSTPVAKLHVHEGTSLGSSVGNFKLLFKLTALSGTNGISRNLWLLKDAEGPDWYTTRFHDGMSVDGSYLTPGTDTRTWWERDPKDNIQSWGHSNQTYFTINAGNVGIGTVTPASILHLKGNASILTIQSMAAEQYAGVNLLNTAGVGLALNTYGSSYAGGGSSLYARANGASLHTNDAASSGLAIAARNTTGYITFHSGGDLERMRISANGNVGIGTSAPDGLQVNAALSQEGSLGVDNIRFGILGNTARIILDDGGATPFEMDNVAGRFRIYNPGVERFTITSSGNVGIGTTSPDQKLTVKGVIHANEVRVDLNYPIEQGPDYVFNTDYNLLPLSEVESYIKANKHLPEVPSAKQMEEQGLNLKEMNLLLLKKVEELTLHLIELEKEKNKVQNQNDVLSTQFDKLSNDIAEIKTLINK